ncbi:hemolysin-III related-domain-containing protein [Mycena rosella]|uniref:Hemolysin-III related-domain-containing protein n=1 Tax=Mycena rosella TaxID=1033263 RepID=A0AAD7DJ69_MYCRO|nr:hemolysin-III related-domain-containing protein [Mycena rosella]
MIPEKNTKRLPRSLTWSQLEPWQRDNPAILTGYRRLTNSWSQTFPTLLWWHDESGRLSLSRFCELLDAPFIQALCFPFRITSQAAPAPSAADAILLRTFLIGALTCFLCSSVFHSSLCHSRKVCLPQFLTGILTLGTVNFFPTFHHAFFCAPRLRNVYIALMMVSGSTGIYMACFPTYATPAYRRTRTYTFFACGGVALLPFVHAIWKTGWTEASASMSFRWLGIEILFYVGGALLYSERFPESLAPGSFDHIGSSHQIFHVCSMFAVLSHWVAIGQGFRYRYGEQGGVCP